MIKISQFIRTKRRELDKECDDMHEIAQTSDCPLSKIPYDELAPGSEELANIMNRFR